MPKFLRQSVPAPVKAQQVVQLMNVPWKLQPFQPALSLCQNGRMQLSVSHNVSHSLVYADVILLILQEVQDCMRAAFGLPDEELNIFGLASDLSLGMYNCC